jgi:hypothetical protein
MTICDICKEPREARRSVQTVEIKINVIGCLPEAQKYFLAELCDQCLDKVLGSIRTAIGRDYTTASFRILGKAEANDK